MQSIERTEEPKESVDANPFEFMRELRAKIEARKPREVLLREISAQASITGLSTSLAEILLDIREDIQSALLLGMIPAESFEQVFEPRAELAGPESGA